MIIGLDVGFSSKRLTSGVARLDANGALRLGHTTVEWESRRQIAGPETAEIAAIDAPYTNAGEAEGRSCERVFTLGAFQRRCKPGLSHVPGTGRSLRAAGWASAQQLKQIAPSRALATEFPRIDGCNVVEAFPNAYLGVRLPADVYTGMIGVRRGHKFDWLYDGWVELGLFRSLIRAAASATGPPRRHVQDESTSRRTRRARLPPDCGRCAGRQVYGRG